MSITGDEAKIFLHQNRRFIMADIKMYYIYEIDAKTHWC